MNNLNDRNTTISTQVITASLTMITVIGAFSVFIIDKRDINIWYYLITGSSFLCFVISVFLGGKGLSGKGANKSPNPYYNWQAIVALTGVMLFCTSVFLGKEKPDNFESKLSIQERRIIELEVKEDCREKRIQMIEKKISTLEDELEKVMKTE